jgi:glycosyltransferase involved in cell wall biosynthesis
MMLAIGRRTNIKPAIVQVVQELAPPGGIQVMVLELGRRLATEFEVHVVSLEGTVERLCATWSRAAAIRDRLHAFDKGPGADLPTVVGLTRLLRRLRPCAVHTHHIGPLLYGGLAARLAGVRALVHTEHDAWHLASPRRRKLERAALAILRPRLVADAEAVAAALVRAIPSSRPRVVPNGIDTALFTPGDRAAARRALGLPASARLIGTAGRLEEVKGHDLLIAALADLPPDVALAIAGDGSQRSSLRGEAADLGLSERIHFLGHVDDVVSFYRAIDIFCLPSRAEGMPLSLLEAQACGVPVVATDVGAVREVLAPDASLAVVAGSAAPLADGLRGMLERPSPADPRPFVTKNYDLQHMARAYRDLLTA